MHVFSTNVLIFADDELKMHRHFQVWAQNGMEFVPIVPTNKGAVVLFLIMHHAVETVGDWKYRFAHSEPQHWMNMANHFCAQLL